MLKEGKRCEHCGGLVPFGSARSITFFDVYLSFKFRKSVEELPTDSPVVIVRHILFKKSCQLDVSGVFVGFETLVK